MKYLVLLYPNCKLSYDLMFRFEADLQRRIKKMENKLKEDEKWNKGPGTAAELLLPPPGPGPPLSPSSTITAARCPTSTST